MFGDWQTNMRRGARLGVACWLLVLAAVSHANPGDFDWAVGFGSEDQEFARAIAVDAVGNVYVTGAFSGTVDFDPGPGTTLLTSPSTTQSIFVAKYSADGSLVWARVMGGSQFSTGEDIAVDSQGNVFVTGFFNGTADFDPGPGQFLVTSPNLGELFVVKLNTNGIFQWAYALSNFGSCLGFALALDDAGHVYVTGKFSGTIEFNPGPGSNSIFGAGSGDIFAVKLDPNGNLIWVRAMGGSGNNEGRGIGVDGAGNVFVAAQFTGSADFDPGAGSVIRESGGNRDLALVKLDANGGLVWVKTMGGSGDNEMHDLAVDASGFAHATGSFNGTVNFDADITNFELTSTIGEDVFVLKVDPNGNLDWVGALGVPFASIGHGIALDEEGNVYTTGSFVGISGTDFNPGPGTFNLTSAGSSDAFISTLNANGNFLSARSVGGPNSVSGRGIAVGPLGSVHVIGTYRDTADFDPSFNTFNLTSNGEGDVFVLSLKGEDDSVPTSVSGTITDAVTEEPIGCAAVELRDIELGTRTVAVTDANGHYFFEPLPPSFYAVRVLAPGYDTLTPASISLGPGEERSEVFQLSPRAARPVVAGRVNDADTGRPLVWVFVRLFINGSFFDSSYTCGNGFYEIPLPVAKDDGTVDIELEFSLPNFETETVQQSIDPAEGATVDESLQKSVLGLSFLTGSVLGRTGPNSKPLEGALITVRGPVSTSAGTEGDGLYFLDTLIDGAYTVTASADGFEGKSILRNLTAGSGAVANFELLSTSIPTIPGDVNGDGVVNAVDVQLVINAALGIAIDPSFEPDINGDGVVNAVDVQLVINAALGIAIGK